jgi:pre-mRNA-splicing factor SYF1
MYAQLEEEHGLAKRAMNIYDRAASAVQDADKFDASIECDVEARKSD